MPPTELQNARTAGETAVGDQSGTSLPAGFPRFLGGIWMNPLTKLVLTACISYAIGFFLGRLWERTK